MHIDLKYDDKSELARDQVSQETVLSWHQVGTKPALSRNEVEEILKKCRVPQPVSELMVQFNWKDRTKFKRKYLNPLIDFNLISMTISDIPNSPHQKYGTTEQGSKLLSLIKKLN
jgi:ATP-dependent DNA helicase RecG